MKNSTELKTSAVESAHKTDAVTGTNRDNSGVKTFAVGGKSIGTVVNVVEDVRAVSGAVEMKNQTRKTRVCRVSSCP